MTTSPHVVTPAKLRNLASFCRHESWDVLKRAGFPVAGDNVSRDDILILGDAERRLGYADGLERAAELLERYGFDGGAR
jgi:hypothetical protein